MAEAIDMFGMSDTKRLASRVPTKKPIQVGLKMRSLRLEHRKEIECLDKKDMVFVDLDNMDDLFLVGGTKPKDVLLKWLDFLGKFYDKDPYQLDKFKLFSNAFLIMSECLPPQKKTVDENNQKNIDPKGQQTEEIDFR